MVTSPERALRRDAERNRQLILEAARDAFAERGLHVTLDEIARRAGVGVATVYRRFADKDTLIEALFEERLADVLELGERALADEDPWAGFVQWLEGFVAMQADDRGLKELVLASDRGRERAAAARERLLPLLERIVSRARRAGELRPDVRASDVALIARMLTGLADSTRELEPALYRRYLTLVLDGLHVQREAPSPLPVPPLRVELLAALRRQPDR